MVGARTKLTGNIEHISAAGDDLTAFSDALRRGVLLHCCSERSDGIGAGSHECGRSKKSSQSVGGLDAAVMLTIGLEQLQRALGKAIPLVQISHLEGVVVQWRTHLEDSDAGG